MIAVYKEHKDQGEELLCMNSYRVPTLNLLYDLAYTDAACSTQPAKAEDSMGDLMASSSPSVHPLEEASQGIIPFLPRDVSQA